MSLRLWALGCMIVALALACRGQISETAESLEPGAPALDSLPYSVYPTTVDQRPTIPSPAITADGVELITAYFDEARAYTLIPVTVENGASRDYRAGHRGKGNQLDVDIDDFPALDCHGVHAEADLDLLRTITGRPIEDITSDARPGALSFAGFLAEDEDIVSVLKGDNRLVIAMELTHRDLAKPLFNVWNILQLHDRRSLDLGRPLQAVNRFWYGDNEVEIISAGYGHGWQTSIFNDGILGMWQIEIRRGFSDYEEAFLNERYDHLDPARRIDLAGRLSYIHTGEMVPFYIMRYGFYEGHTSYRADPIAIAFIFGLRSLAQLDAAFGGKLDVVLTTHFNVETVTGAPAEALPELCAVESLRRESDTDRR